MRWTIIGIGWVFLLVSTAMISYLATIDEGSFLGHLWRWLAATGPEQFVPGALYLVGGLLLVAIGHGKPFARWRAIRRGIDPDVPEPLREKRSLGIRAIKFTGRFVRRWTPRLWRVGKWAAALGLIALIAYIVWTNHRGNAAITRLEEKFEQRGLPTSAYAWERENRNLSPEQIDMSKPELMRLGETRRILKPDENGARFYRAAFELIELSEEEREDLPIIGSGDPPEPRERIQPELMADLEAFFDRRATAYSLIEQAREQTTFDYQVQLTPQDINNEVMLMLGRWRMASRCLKLNSLHAQGRGDAEGVFEAIHAIMDMASSFDHEPGLITTLVRMSCDGLAYGAIHDALTRIEPTPEQARRMAAHLAERRDQYDLSAVLQSEITSGFEQLREQDPETVYQREVEGQRAVRRAVRSFGGEATSNDALFRDLVDNTWRIWLIICPGYYEMTVAQGIEAMIAEHAALASIGDDPLAVHQYLSDQPRRGPTGLVTGIRAAAGTWVDFVTKIELTRVALFVEAHRIEHGQWPAELSQLEEAVPTDPYSGEPIQYRRLDDGVAVYSVGRNGTDERGRGQRQGLDAGEDREADDLAVRLYDSKLRNIEPAARPDDAQSEGGGGFLPLPANR